MATKSWVGNALASFDVWTLTPGGTIEVGDLFLCTINGKVFTYAATDTTVASVVTGFVAAYNALSSSIYPEHKELTASASGTTAILLTANKAGVPMGVAVSTTEAGGGAADLQTFSASNTTVASGPNWWTNVANWAGGVLPVATDDVIIADGKVDILYGLDQNTITLASLTIDSTYTGKIGLPRRNDNGYQEYREQYLRISATTVTIGQGSGSGSGRLKLNTGAVAATVRVFGTGNTAESGVESFLWKGTSASNALFATQGSIGVAVHTDSAGAAETANLSGGLSVGYETSQTTDVHLRTGPGVTLATVTQTGGDVLLNSSATVVDRTGGTMTQRGASVITTLNNRGGTFVDESTGTITTVEQQATYDRTRTLQAKTITTLRMYKGSKTWTPQAVTYTNAPEFFGCRPGVDGTEFDFGTHKKITIAAI